MEPLSGRATMSRWAARGAVTALGVLSAGGYAVDLHARFGTGLGVLGVYVWLFSGLFALYLLAAWVVRHSAPNDRVVLALVLGFGLVFRLAVMSGPVVLSSDVYRYLWEGRVQWAGFNPYRFAPAAPELASLRDGVIYPNINRPTKRTIYPPAAQAAFALVAGIAPNSVTAWRLFLLACEVITHVFLLGLVRRMGVPATAIIFYAWAPLVVFEGVGAGHIEVVVVPLILLALRWRQEGRLASAGAALGLATLLKLYPAVLVLAWWRRRDWTLPAAAALVVALGYLPYVADAGREILGFLPEYLSGAEDFNVGLRFFLTEGLGATGERPRALVMVALCGILVAVVVAIRRRLIEDPAGVLRAGMRAMGALLIFTPTSIYPWYAVSMVPWLVASPVAPWLWFTGAVTLSYLFYAATPLGLPLWARLLEFLPLYGLLLARWRRHGGRREDRREPSADAACLTSKGARPWPHGS